MPPLSDWSDVELMWLYTALERRYVYLFEHNDHEDRLLDAAATRVLTLILKRSAA